MTANIKQIDVEGIGIISLKKTANAKRLAIRIAPNKHPYVTIPPNYTFEQAIDFVKTKKEWILKGLKKVKAFEKKKNIYTESTPNITKSHSLVLKQHTLSNIRLQVGNKMILVSYPASLQPENEQIQKAIDDGILIALKNEANRYLPIRTAQLAKLHNLKFSKITLRNTKTRWGSCSGTNSISLSIQLMRLPEHLIDYVILHELAHTIHKNHGPGFWKFLNTLTNGKAIALRKELRSNS